MKKALKHYINKNRNLFWYIPEDKKENISESLLVETILNYGTMDDVRELIAIMGLKRISAVFFAAKGRMKSNYYPEIFNFFSHVFTRYAQRDS